jgi:hypothetical protein
MHIPSVPNAAWNVGRHTPPSVNIAGDPRTAHVTQSFVRFILPRSWQTPIESHGSLGPVPVVELALVALVAVLELVVLPVPAFVVAAVGVLLVEVACVVEAFALVVPPLPPGAPGALFAQAADPRETMSTKQANLFIVPSGASRQLSLERAPPPSQRNPRRSARRSRARRSDDPDRG